MSAMRTHALQTDALPEVPRLRLVPRQADTQSHSRPGTSARRRDTASGARRNARGESRATGAHSKGAGEPLVLVAGGERSSRAEVMRDLTATMPANTRFDEASDAWEVLALAGESRMVVLSGDLGDLSAKSAMNMLAHRLPEVPVVSLAAA
jgi:hypothetical protein